MSNPLLHVYPLPAFDRIRPEHVEAAIDETLGTVRQRIDALLEPGPPFSWENLAAPLEAELEHLHRVWSPVSHLNAVMNNDELRAAYNACLPKLSAFETEIGQHEGLYQAFKDIASREDFAGLDCAQQKAIKNRLRDFRLTGIELAADEREQFKQIQQRLAELQARFRENLLDATNAWSKQVADESLLAGLPETARALARQTAARRGVEGWTLTLELPSYYPVLTYADDRGLREEVYTAYVTRAADAGPHAGQWDNTDVMEEILELRHKAARMLGFENFGDRSLATKMASSTAEVVTFLEDLAQRALAHARSDLEEVREFARRNGATFPLEAWDIPYYSEQLRQERYALSQEELKPYFPHTRVIAGLFSVAGQLYGIDIRQRNAVPVWHPDVRVFEIFDDRGELRGQFYLDLFARPKKQGGAWMDECRTRLRLNGEVQVPVAYLTCNFTPPIGDRPALLGHDEVITLFHEFGHGLHHLLSRIDYPSISGINGVAWDAVELPSQFMENWCWEREALDLISGHYETGERIPDDMFQRMRASRNFQSAMQMVRQLEFALFDMQMHVEYQPELGGRIYAILERVRNNVAVVQPPPFNRFAHGFSHVFGGGYAAGYYSYKWAEVLSADAFSLFEENGIFDRTTGLHFMREVLEQGGARDPMELFIAFRGRQPGIEALLRHSGLNP
ncbi:MAG: oligopeptidase A [Thiogranum sp.]|nr:oligopeptidase A [Thiogranum sp.]